MQLRVEAKVAKNECLLCDLPIHKLGLCVKCAAKHDYRIRCCTSQRKKIRYIKESAQDGNSLVAGELPKLRAKFSSNPAAALQAAIAL